MCVYVYADSGSCYCPRLEFLTRPESMLVKWLIQHPLAWLCKIHSMHILQWRIGVIRQIEVCGCVYMCMRVEVLVCICVCVCGCVYVYGCMYTCGYRCVMYMWVSLWVHVFMWVRVSHAKILYTFYECN